jgi:hypothetical protein
VTATPDLIPLALRVHVEPPPRPDRDRGLARVKPRLTRLVVLRGGRDSGRLHLYEQESDAPGGWRRQAEYVWHRDDLPRARLNRFKAEHLAMTERAGEGRAIDGVPCVFLPKTEFLRVLYLECVQEPGALICGYGLTADLISMADELTPARKEWYRGGFSLRLWPKEPGKRGEWRPRVLVKMGDDGNADLAFGTVSLPGGKSGGRTTWVSPSELLDLQRLVNALAGQSLSLDDAAAAFGLIDEGCPVDIGDHSQQSCCLQAERARVELAAALTFRLLDDVDCHPWSRGAGGAVSETKLRSTASIGKLYLDDMGVKPRLELQPDFPREVFGHSMEAFYGGLALNGLRGVVPVVTTDVTSMFATIACLLGHWKFWIAASIRVEPCLDWVLSFLADVTREDLFDRTLWCAFNVFCQVAPDQDWLPTHGRYDPDSSEWAINRGPVSDFPRPCWWALPDVIYSTLKTGKVPRVLDAFRLVPEGVQEELKPIRFRGVIDFDPGTCDFFKALVEERAKVKKADPPYERMTPAQRNGLEWGMKLATNSIAWGDLAEVNREPAGYRKQETVDVWTGAGSFTQKVSRVERGGRWYFPPLAAITPSGARLLLGVLQDLVEQHGGSFAYADTDSMAIVAQEQRGTVNLPDGSTMGVLSWADVRTIQAEIDRLNPYDPRLIPHLLKLEEENFADPRDETSQRQIWADVVSPKRYAIFQETTGNAKDRELIKWSEAGLGHYPELGNDSRYRWWQARIRGEACPFGDLPAVSRVRLSNWELYERMRNIPWARGTVLAVSVAGPGGRRLIAPENLPPEKWWVATWIDPKTGQGCRIVSVGTLTPRRPVRVDGPGKLPLLEEEVPTVWVKSMGDVWEHYFDQAMITTRAIDGRICDARTYGQLAPRAIRPSRLLLVGKDSWEIGPALLGSNDETALTYREEAGDCASFDARHGQWDDPEWIAFRSSRLFCDWTAEAADARKASGPVIFDRRLLFKWKNGVVPDGHNQRKTFQAAECYARKVLAELGCDVPDHRPTLFARYDALVPGAVEQIRVRLESYVAVHKVRPAARTLGMPEWDLRRWLGGKSQAAVSWIVAVGQKLDQIYGSQKCSRHMHPTNQI